MYTDDEGKFNGEALFVYFKKDSFTLAIQMMDDYFFTEERHDLCRCRVLVSRLFMRTSEKPQGADD
jgi:hypothetical protein